MYVEKVFIEIDDIISLESEVNQNTSDSKLQALHDLLLVWLCRIWNFCHLKEYLIV